MVSLKYILLATGVSAAVIPAVDFSAAVLSGLQRINADTVALAKENQAFDSQNPSSAAPIFTGVLLLEGDIVGTGQIAALSPGQFSESGAQAIIDYVNSPLEPNTVHTIGTLEANRASIQASGLTVVVQAQLVALKTAVDQLVNAIEAHMPSSKLASAKQALGTYAADYAAAAQYFS